MEIIKNKQVTGKHHKPILTDLAFQKKCVEKMQDVAESGMTILFVSHNMASIKIIISDLMKTTNYNVNIISKNLITFNKW